MRPNGGALRAITNAKKFKNENFNSGMIFAAACHWGFFGI
jgi:hypothetical protein